MTQEHPERPPAESRREQAATCLRRHGYDKYAEELEQTPELVSRWRAEGEQHRENNRKWTGEKKYLHYRDGAATALETVSDELAEVLADDE